MRLHRFWPIIFVPVPARWLAAVQLKAWFGSLLLSRRVDLAIFAALVVVFVSAAGVAMFGRRS